MVKKPISINPSNSKQRVVRRKKLTKEINELIKDKYYSEKPVIKLNKPVEEYLKTFKVSSIEEDVGTAEQAKQLFDKVVYPVKLIVPKNKVKKLGIESMVPSTWKNKPNDVHYFTKNKSLTEKQYTLLYLEEDIRDTHGFRINGVRGFGSTANLMKYQEAKLKIEKKALERRLKIEEEKLKKSTSDKKELYKNLSALTRKIFESNEQLIQPIKKIREPMDSLRASLNPFSFGFKPPKDGLLGKTILGGATIARPSIPKIKPDGVKRTPITGTGLTTYMAYHKLKNPVEIAKKFLTKEGKFFKEPDGKERKYEAKGFDHLRLICEQMNVNVEEAFLYICEGMNDSKARWQKHRLDKEFWRGSQSVVNLVKYYNEQVDIAKKDKNKIAYTVKALHGSSYCTNFFEEYGVHKPDYTKFTAWFKKMKHHVEVLNLDKK